jgi:iron complex transport system permease protein
MVGAALAAAGAAYQALFRNPLVSPDILGVSAGSAFGAALGIVLSLDLWWIQCLAFASALSAVATVYLFARAMRGHDPVLMLILAGVVVGALFGSLLSLLKYLADPYDQLPAITFWLLGSLAAIDGGDVATTLPIVILGLVPLWLLRWRLDLLSLGDDEAKALGVNVARLRPAVIGAATLTTAAVVSISGIVGWVGLLIPHGARFLVGPNFSRLLPVSMLLGGAFLLLVDTLARVAARIEIPLGVLTAFIGTPFFIWLLATARRSWQ